MILTDGMKSQNNAFHYSTRLIGCMMHYFTFIVIGSFVIKAATL